MRVFIHACEGTYQGLYGIEALAVEEVSSETEANNIGYEMAQSVIESYGLEDEYEDEVFEPELNWSIWKIDEKKCAELSIQELDNLCANLGEESFVKKYCGELI